MDIKILASSSSGNCYRISDGHTALLLECGISIQRIKEGLEFKLSDISGCLISHEHKDHCKAAGDVLKAGVTVYMSNGTKEALGAVGHRVKVVEALKQFKIGTFMVLPFDTRHDAQEPLGYLIYSKETDEKLLFATDTYYVKYKFIGLNIIMVEANYVYDILHDNIVKGLVPEALKNRLLTSHFSLDNVKKFLLANDLSKVQEIYLMHLSSGNSDAKRFKREIQEITGRQVIIC
jgi:phosphoribosyl 1,2-cyclic phosphodiesterase